MRCRALAPAAAIARATIAALGGATVLGAIAALGSAAACVPARELEIPWAAQSFLAVTLIGDTARVFAAEGAPPALTRAFPPDTRLFLVGYDRPLSALALVIDTAGEVALADRDAGPDDGWPLPPPDRWTDLLADPPNTAHAPPEPLDAALDALRLAPPPCPTYEIELVARGYSSASAIARASDGAVLVGVEPETEVVGGTKRLARPPLILAVDPGGLTALQPPTTLTPTAAFAPTPLLFTAGNGVRVTWGSDQRNPPPGRSRSYALTATLGYADDLPFDLPGVPAAFPQAVAGARVDGVLSVVGSFDDNDGAEPWTHHLYAARGRTFTRIAITEPAPPPDDGCQTGVFTHIFELAPDGHRGLVGLRKGPVRELRWDGDRYVLGAVYGPTDGGLACRTTHTTLASGIELFAWDTGPGGGIRLAWREGRDAPWALSASSALITATCAANDGDVAYLCASGGDSGSVAVFDRDPRRPELPPRRCPDVLSQVRPRTITQTRYGLLVTGFDGIEWLRRHR